MNLNLIKALWNVMNGKKMDTGTFVVIGAFLLQHFLKLDSTESTNIATNIMMGVGGIIMVIGYIHKQIKARTKLVEKKE